MRGRRVYIVAASWVALCACGQSSTKGSSGGTTGNGVPGDAGLSVNSVTPAGGPLTGGTSVVVAGTGFAPGLVLTFGGAAASQVQVLSGTALSAVTPPGASAGPVAVTAALAGVSATLAQGFSYGAPTGSDLAFCVLHFPGALATTPEVSPSQPVLGWVGVPGLTDQGRTQGSGVLAQVGFGPLGSTPGAGWNWAGATWTGKSGVNDVDDQYAGTLPPPPTSGRFNFAVRFSVNGGLGWTACDTVGNTPTAPYQPAAAGVLDVAPPEIAFCQTHDPPALTTVVGQGAGPAHGWVTIPGVTDQGFDAGAGVYAQLGQGPTGSTPGSAWSWVSASWVSKVGAEAGGDAYVASLPVQGDAGVFAYAFRFALDGGAGWQSCDLSGDLTYVPADGGTLTVLPVDGGLDAGSSDGGLADAGRLVANCRFAYPASLVGEAFALSTPLLGVVGQPGVTPGIGQGAGILAQAGIGPLGSNPDDAGWSWTPASYAGDVDGPLAGDLAADSYSAQLLFLDAGSYGLAYRFSLDDGGSWRTCDASGDSAYQATHEATCTLVAGPLRVDFCDLEMPATATASPGQSAGLAFGEIYKAGVTDQDLLDAGAGIVAQLGVGPLAADPTLPDSGFVWAPAAFDGKRGPLSHNDEYQAQLVAPAPAGTYAYFFRFSEDEGKAWTVCGYQNPISLGGDAGLLTVP